MCSLNSRKSLQVKSQVPTEKAPDLAMSVRLPYSNHIRGSVSTVSLRIQPEQYVDVSYCEELNPSRASVSVNSPCLTVSPDIIALAGSSKTRARQRSASTERRG